MMDSIKLADLNSMSEFLVDLEESLFGPKVKVIRTLYTGDVVEEIMPAAVAVDTVLRDPINGAGEVTRSRIEWGDVIDVWGISM